MRILQLGKFYPIRGGVEKVMFDLTVGISSAGIPCDMLCAAFQSESVKEIRLNGLGRVICVKAISKKAGTMLSMAMIRYLRIHKNEYDIIHIHHPDPMAALALRLSGFQGPVVLHWHSDILSQKALLALYRPLQSWLLRRATRIVCTTPVYLRESPWLRTVQDKGAAIPIGIEPIRPNPEKAEAFRSRFPGKNILLSVGRLVPYKGYDYLIEAMQYLPDTCHLVIGGTGPLQQQLENRVAALQLQDRVTLLGYVPDEDLPAWFTACDVFVLPSVMKTEAFGIVQIEAMSCGKPVVATRIPESGVSWVNQHGVSGINVPPCEPKALAKGIQKALGHATTLGEGAKQLFRERYTIQSMIQKTISLYENLENR